MARIHVCEVFSLIFPAATMGLSGDLTVSVYPGHRQRNRLKVEEKELDFIFEVANVQFNQLGKYILVLTVENPLKNESGTGLKLRINDGDVLQTSSGQTDAISQNNLDEVCTCMCNKFVFTLPKGYCKNDKNHDVRLKVEALRVLNSDEKDGVKSGEGFFAIYPRTNAPRINLYAGQEEELYQYSGIMALLRVHDDHLSMHCGRLVYSVAFHEARPFLKEGGRSSQLSSLLAGDPPEEVPLLGTSTLQVPTLSLGLSQRHSALVSRSQDLTTTEDFNISLVPSPPTSPKISQKSPKREPETQMDLSSDSLPSTPRSGASSCPEPSSQTLKPGDHVLLQDTPAQTPEPLQYKHAIESPCDGDQSVASDLLVSNPGMESITFILHGATSLPPLSDGGVPQPYAIVKSAADEDHGRRSQGVTSCTLQPTHSPSWEEKITVELSEKQTCGDVVVLNVADSRTKEILAHYRLPVRHLQPFHHYHLELVQTHSSIPHGVNLYVTVVRKLSTLPRQPHFSFTGFEVLLQAMETPLKEPVGPLFSVARIVPDYHSYRDAMLLHTPRAAGVTVTTVHFPQPPESAFSPALLSAQGRPQVSLAASPEQQPVWNHSFLFLERDCATMFSGAAALVLEFYPTTSVLHAASWHLRSPVGFSALSLHPALYRKLMSERGQRGVRVWQLPLRGSNLRTTVDSTPSVSIVLRLIGSERPDSLLTAEEPGLIPSLDPETLDEDDWIPASEAVLPPQTDQEQGTITIQTPPCPEQPTQPQHPSLQRDGYSLPSYDALAQILPDYQHLFSSDKPTAPGQVHQRQDRPSNAAEAPQNTKTGRLPDFEDDPHIAQIAELQTKEVENYRTAMRKMAEDIITLRSQVVGLELDNSQLRSDLSLHQDLGRNLLDDTDIDVMTKTEIADRIASLKFKLASETSKSSSQRDKIQQLQNDLIRKNDTEKELVRLQRAHQQQQEALQSYQSRVAKLGVLETTVRHQEKVIEKMEKVLDNKLTEKNKENSDRELRERGRKTMWKKSTGEDGNIKAEIESALAAENCRLRGELERLRQQQAPIIIQQPPQDAFPDKEKLSLLGRLEKADSRVQALETQLKENSKRWGRQKQEMLTRLSEQNCGFARTSTTILHDLPLKSVSDSLMNWRRHRQPKPKK